MRPKPIKVFGIADLSKMSWNPGDPGKARKPNLAQPPRANGCTNPGNLS